MSDEPIVYVQVPKPLLSWLKLTVVLTLSFTILSMIPLVLDSDDLNWLFEVFLIFIVIWTIPSALIALLIKALPWFRERPRCFLLFPAVFGGLYFYMTEIYFVEKIDIALPEQTGTVAYSQKSEMTLMFAPDYYYYRSIKFHKTYGSSVTVKMSPNRDHETAMEISWFNGIVRFQDKYDTAWIDTNAMCGIAAGNPEAVSPEKKCQKDFSQITDWLPVGVISDKTSDGLVFLGK